MNSYLHSLHFSLQGLRLAWKTERNLKLFVSLYALSIVIATLLTITIRDWEMVIFTGGIFLAVELLNTALERFTDAFDLHSQSVHTPMIKATKDIAAGASLVCAIAWGLILCMIFLPELGSLRFGGIGAGM